jgi:hypothetical protein
VVVGGGEDVPAVVGEGLAVADDPGAVLLGLVEGHLLIAPEEHHVVIANHDFEVLDAEYLAGPTEGKVLDSAQGLSPDGALEKANLDVLAESVVDALAALQVPGPQSQVQQVRVHCAPLAAVVVEHHPDLHRAVLCQVPVDCVVEERSLCPQVEHRTQTNPLLSRCRHVVERASVHIRVQHHLHLFWIYLEARSDTRFYEVFKDHLLQSCDLLQCRDLLHFS